MSSSRLQGRGTLGYVAVVACLAAVRCQGVTGQTVSFQNGVDGYTGTFDRRISDREGDEANGVD
ncbi:MAG: hypothetical protein AAF961_15275, partial [Planctomycetota bacterium]